MRNDLHPTVRSENSARSPAREMVAHKVMRLKTQLHHPYFRIKEEWGEVPHVRWGGLEVQHNPHIDALKNLPLTDGSADILSVHRRLVKLAKRATVEPETLTLNEIAQIAYALEVHYAQMGID